MATKPAATSPVVLLVEPSKPDHHHADMLTSAGFRVVNLPAHELTERAVQHVKPAIIAVELDGARSRDAVDLAPRLRAAAAPRAEPIPVIVYGHGLSAADIERAATSGAMWLQLEPAEWYEALSCDSRCADSGRDRVEEDTPSRDQEEVTSLGEFDARA